MGGNGNGRLLALTSLILSFAAVVSAAGGNVVGQPGSPGSTPNFGGCDSQNLTFVGPSDCADLYQFRSATPSDSRPSSSDVLYNILGGNYRRACDYADANGTWKCVNNSFLSPPTSNLQTVWAIAPFYEGGTPTGTSEGWLMYDNSPGLDDASSRPNVTQRLRPVQATMIGGSDGQYVDVSFEYLSEFDEPIGDLCFAGGDQTPRHFDTRLFAGFNVYRLDLSDVDRDVSDPVHYLCGPDRNCDTPADNGWIGFISLDPDDPAHASIDDPDLPNDDPQGHPYGAADRGGRNPHVFFLDGPVPVAGGYYSYIVQPVLRMDNPAALADWGGLSNASLDLNGDGFPEFLDPSSHGLGLTANGCVVPTDNGCDRSDPLCTTPDVPWILISGEGVTDPTVTPAIGALELTARPNGRGSVLITFLSSIEGDVIGFNVYRSTDGVAFSRINEETIPADGSALNHYVVEDDMRGIRGLRIGQLQYRLEVILADGTSEFYGPFDAEPGRGGGLRRR